MSIESILNVISRETGITIDEMKEKHRKREKVEARMIAAYFIREFMPETSLVKIGQILGGRDHSTIIHYMNSLEDLVFSNGPFFNKIEAIRDQVQSIFPKKISFTWDWETDTTF